MRRYFLLVFTLCLCISVPTIAAPPEEGLVLWFGFNEDTEETIDDLSGAGNNGTITGTVEWTGDGKYGGGIQFTDGVISVPNSETVTFEDEITIALWIKSDEVSDSYRWLVAAGWAGNGSYILGIDNHWGNMAFAWDVKNVEGIRFDANMDALVIPGEWQFVAGTYDASMIKLYVNGEMKVQTAADGKITSASDVTISQQGLGIEGGSFIGIMDEIRLYNIALSDEEIQQAMEEPEQAAVSPAKKLSTAWGAVKCSY